MYCCTNLNVSLFREVSSHVPTPKHEAKHGCITRKLLFVCFVKQLNELLLVYISVLSFMF